VSHGHEPVIAPKEFAAREPRFHSVDHLGG
jgi:hypothetical protein